MSRSWTRELGMLGASLVAAYSVARLATGATTATMVTGVIGTVLVAGLRRRQALALATGVAAVAASALWFGLHVSVRSGLPSTHALLALRGSLQSARALLVSFNLPLAHTQGIVALWALLGGLIAVAGRAMGSRTPALSLVPAAVLSVWSAILLPTTGAALTGVVLGSCGFLVLITDVSPARVTPVTVAGISLSLAALTLGWSAVAGSNVVSQGGKEVPAVAPSALSLATDLTGVQSRDANVVLFRAKSAVSTYWQVATLTAFAGDRWVPDPATTALLRGSTPGKEFAPPSSPHLFTAGVTLAAYSGRLLPVPPATVAASGDTSPVVTSSGVVATGPVHAQSSYTVTAVVPSPVGDTSSGAPQPDADTSLGPVPALVRSLALSITSGQTSPLDKAEALTDYFRSGRFHYKIIAAQPAGVDPLVAFLTQTRTGSCEDFAGAFAVLARASGLATRVAVGFTPGRRSNGVTVVRGLDAHAWPEVLIGGAWVSFEPTPQIPSGELSPPGVLGPSGLGQPNPTGHNSKPPVSIPVVTTPAPTIPPPTLPATAVAHPDRWSGVLALVLLVLALVTVAVAALGLKRRRRTPIDRVAGAWKSVDRALVRRGVARPVWRTPMGHVHALSRWQRDEHARAALEDMATVAALLEDMAYGSIRLSSDEVDRATRASGRARRAILGGALSRPEDADRATTGPVRRPYEYTSS